MATDWAPVVIVGGLVIGAIAFWPQIVKAFNQLNEKPPETLKIPAVKSSAQNVVGGAQAAVPGTKSVFTAQAYPALSVA